jgi:GTP-binding protein
MQSSKFLISNTEWTKCPKPNKPEYAFIGRSNVGKSSLINMITDRKALAKISGTPGKTQLINHFLINENHYFADLPGYGYAKVSKKKRQKFQEFTLKYLKNRSNLMSLFILLDSRIEAQKIDLEFMEFCGINKIPFVMCFTKIDKLNSSILNKNMLNYKKKMLQSWDNIPQVFLTSSVSSHGKENILNYIEQTNKLF